jgi:molecular chaperone DnaK
MTQRKVYLGIDLGTSNSSIAYVLGGDPRDAVAQKIPVHVVKVSMDEEGGAKAERLPSVIASSLDRRSRKPLMGWEFFHELSGRKRKTGLLRHGETFFRSVKSDLGSLRVYPHACMTEFQTPEKVAAAILKRLLKEAEEALPGYNLKKAQVMISVPASLNTLGREHTLEAARLAGLDTDSIQLVDEPVAALLDWLNDGRAAGVLDTSQPKNVLVFDYGGGTLDLSLVRARFDPTNQTTGLHVENLAISQYRRLGGDDVDRAVMSEIVWPQIKEQRGTERDALPSDLRQQIEDTLTPTVARRLKEGICRKIKETSREGHRAARKLEHIEPLQVIFEEIELPRNFKITADGFQEVMWPFLMPPNEDVLADEDLRRQCLLVPVLEVLKRGGIETEELHALVLHGGSCRNPLVRELLTETFGDQTSLFHNTQVLETPDLDTSVAKGAALTAYWRHERDTHIVTPIIAEDIGILTLDDKPVKLLKSGQSLPFPDGDGVHEVPVPFYVPQSKLRHLLVPFYTGQHTRRITECLWR